MHDEVQAFLKSVFGHHLPEAPDPEPLTMTPERFLQTLAKVLFSYKMQALSARKGNDYFSLSVWPLRPGLDLISFSTPNCHYTIEVPSAKSTQEGGF